MDKEVDTVSGGIGFTGLLTIVFITLKLLNVITWSWWWVLAPVWIPVAFTLVIILLLIFGCIGMWALGRD